MNKELEEAAQKHDKYVLSQIKEPGFSYNVFSFIEGAKWQAEKMYSEEELLQALNLGFTSTDETWEQCVAFAKEQFKKK